MTKPVDAAIARDAEQKISGHGGAGEATRRGDEHVAGLALGAGRDESQIIVGAAVAGQRDTEEGTADDRLDAPVERARAAHRVDDEARRRAAESLDQLGRRSLDGRREHERGRFLDHSGPGA